MAEIFKNFPFVTDEEIAKLVGAKTLPQLEIGVTMERNRFSFYQKSPFFLANSDKHKAHLSCLDRLIKKIDEELAKRKGGVNET